MILQLYFKDDIMDFIQNIPGEIFKKNNISKDAILSAPEIVEKLWYEYQKLVEEYGCDEEWAKRETVNEILKIDIKNQVFFETSEKNCTYIRDMMVQLAKSLTIMLQKAAWSVCVAEKIISENSDLGIKLIDGFCGYSIDDYSKEEKREIVLIPVLKDGCFAIFVIFGEERKLFPIYDIHQNISVLLDIHEYVSMNEYPVIYVDFRNSL